MKIKRTVDGKAEIVARKTPTHDLVSRTSPKAAGCALALLGVHHQAAHALDTVLPIATISCYCASAAELQASANDWFLKYSYQTLPGYPSTQLVMPNNSGLGGPGTLLIVSSTEYALSGAYRATWYSVPYSYMLLNYVRGLTDGDAIKLDGELVARSTKIPPVILPPSIPPNETPEIIEGFVAGVLVQTGQGGNSLWHGLFPGTVGQVAYVIVKDTQTGQTYTMWANDPITIRFSNGWSCKVIWSPFSDPQFQIVPNSMRDQNGNPPGSTTSPPASQNGPSTDLGNLGDPSTGIVYVSPDAGSTPTGTVTIEPTGQVEVIVNSVSFD